MGMPAWAVTIVAWVQWFFDKGVAGISAAWKTSRTATEIAIVGFVLFVVLVYFGVFQRPDIAPDVTKELTALSLKLDAIKADMASKDDVANLEGQISGITPAKRLTTGSIAPRKPSKAKDAE